MSLQITYLLMITFSQPDAAPTLSTDAGNPLHTPKGTREEAIGPLSSFTATRLQ